jgi:RNA methyltransferase, TrmH family
LGTIIRIADWYGITDIVASETTTDVYGPKVIAASMGSFIRVRVHYTSLENLLTQAKSQQIHIFGSYVHSAKTVDVHTLSNRHAKNLKETDSVSNNSKIDGIILMGSESHGIRKELTPLVTTQVTIPRYSKAESLNVSVATAIILDNIVR